MAKEGNWTPRFDYPGLNPDELYALERNARRERAEVMGRLLVEGTGKLAAVLGRAGSAIGGALRGEPHRA
jgi:hypothetical protein